MPAKRLRNVQDILLRIRISNLPYMEPKDAEPFVDQLLQEQSKYLGETYVSKPFDRASFERFRSALNTPRRPQA